MIIQIAVHEVITQTHKAVGGRAVGNPIAHHVIGQSATNHIEDVLQHDVDVLGITTTTKKKQGESAKMLLGEFKSQACRICTESIRLQPHQLVVNVM